MNSRLIFPVLAVFILVVVNILFGIKMYNEAHSGCNADYAKGDFIRIKGQDDCNCLVQWTSYESVGAICTDQFGKTTELSLEAENILKCQEKVQDVSENNR